MGIWLTDKSPIIQGIKPNTSQTLENQLLYSDGILYLVPHNTLTDGYTIPLGINKTKWDIRGASLHDIGCKYHQVIIVNLPLRTVEKEYIRTNNYNKYICLDIPKEHLLIKDVSFKECNDLLYSGMVGSNIPKGICKLYRNAVNLNIHWLFTGKDKIDINNIYNNILYT